MSDQNIKCPMCPVDAVCDHDQEERQAMCAHMGLTPEPVEAELPDKKRRVKRKDTKEADGDLLAVMALPQGRRFVKRMLDTAGVYRLSYRPNDPTRTAFLEGGRNVGLYLLAQIGRVAPADAVRMLTETGGHDAS